MFTIQQHQGILLTTKKFELSGQAFGYCTDAQIGDGTCQPTSQFLPGREPLQTFLWCTFDTSYVGKDIQVTLIIQSAPGGQLIWSISGGLRVQFAETLAWFTFVSNPTPNQLPYPTELKNMPKGRYVYIAAITTPDGSDYSERSMPFVVR